MSCTVQIANHRKAIGLLYAGVQTAANAGVLQNQAGLAAALITTSFQLGSALGLAVFSGLFSGIAASRTSHLLAAHTPPPEALTARFQRVGRQVLSSGAFVPDPRLVDADTLHCISLVSRRVRGPLTRSPSRLRGPF